MVTCKGCGKTIEWIRTPAGKQMPVDPELVTVVLADGRIVRGRVPHWVTCPKAQDFKQTTEVAPKAENTGGMRRCHSST